jgi:DNA-binding transcriptional LysR family regulator
MKWLIVRMKGSRKQKGYGWYRAYIYSDIAQNPAHSSHTHCAKMQTLVPKMHDWNDLRFFLELARAGRLIQAAARLRVDHTTVARRISALEAAIGARLFDKSPRGYVLTEAGHQLLAHAEGIEAQSIRAFEQISGQDAQRTGTIRLATPEAFGSYFLSPRLGGFFARYPGIDLELVADNRPLSLSKREADVLVTLNPPDSGRLLVQRLTGYTLGLYAAPTYLAAMPPLRTAADLAGHHVVTYIEDLVMVPELRALMQLVQEARAPFRSTSIAAQTSAVAAGLGIGLLHDFAAANRPDLAPVLQGEVGAVRDYWLVIPEDLRHVARIEALAEFLVSACRAAQKVLVRA